jgi:hypothetical protein
MDRREVLMTGAAAAAFVSLGNAQSATWKPKVLSAAQNEVVVTLSELIIPATDTPGAKAALVNRYLDLLLAETEPEGRERFLSGLRWLDEFASKEYGAVFVKLPQAIQIEVLEKLDTEEAPAEGARFFREVKGHTVRIYYQTEIGWKELNKRGVPRGFGCSHEAHKVGL